MAKIKTGTAGHDIIEGHAAKFSRLLAVLAVSIATMAPQAAGAAVIYGAYRPVMTPQLGTIDTITGADALIGSTGGVQLFGGAFDTDGTFYGIVDAQNSPNPSKLATINLATGQATVIGNTGIGTPGNIADQALALEISANGTAYTVGWDDNLYTLNKSTGLATKIGPMGIDIMLMDLAIDSLGTLWGTDINKLWTIDLSTGAATFKTDIVGNFDPIVMGIAFDANDRLFATTFGLGTVESPSILMEVNTTNGTTTIIDDNIGIRPHGGDIFIALATPVPEPGTLALLSTGLLGLFWARRRRRPKTDCSSPSRDLPATL